MPAKSFTEEILSSLSKRSDVVCNTYPLRYKRGDYDFIRISSSIIKPDDKVMLIAAGIHGDEIAGPLRRARENKGGPQIMPLINLVIVLMVVGVLLWLVNNYMPMDGKIKQILNIVVVIAVVVWVLNVFGILGSGYMIHVGR